MKKEEIKSNLIKIGFVDNGYIDKYCELIENNKNTKKEKYKTQSHHIIPKCYFKIVNQKIDNSPRNKVNLLYKDHILAHYYLCLCSSDPYKEKLIFSFIRMTFQSINKIQDFNFKNLYYYQTLYEENSRLLGKINKNNFINMYKNKSEDEIKNILDKKSKSAKKFYSSLNIEEKNLINKRRADSIRNMSLEKKEKRNERIKNTKANFTKEYKKEIGRKINLSRGFESFEDICKRISRQDLYNYYIIENHSKENTEKFFNVKDTLFCKLLNFYNIHKFKSHFHIKNKFKELELKKEEIIDLYLKENWTVKQLASKYEINSSCFSKFLRLNNIKKRKFNCQFSRGKPIKCIETNIIYNNIKEASLKLNISYSSLSSCLEGKQKTAGKFHWEFVNKN